MSEGLDDTITQEELARLRKSEERYGSLMKDLREGIYITTDKGFVFINPAGAHLLGYEHFEELLLLDPKELYVDHSQRERINEQVAKKGFVKDYELRLRRKNGSIIIVEDTVHLHNGENGEVEYWGVIRDITQRKLNEARLLYQATHDSLTGLYNRQAFFDHFTEEVARQWKYKAPSHLMFIDINGFKTLNDTEGHLAGDNILRKSARLLMDNFRGDYNPPTLESITNGKPSRKNDFLARTGGDEFVVLPVVPNGDDTLAGKLAQKAYDLMLQAGISPSIGVSKFPDHVGDAADALKAVDLMYHRADVAMYAAKRMFKKGTPVPYIFYDPDSMRA
ncbi:GGDEF domain-containing protein [Candidatus Woesearchaeota archaeon]|nr:GGDEF domain-containing protein [Candidatus Woesearchaeota archaeon]